MPPCPVPTHWWQMREPGLLLCWELWLGRYSGVFFFVCLFCFFLLVIFPLGDSITPDRSACHRVSYYVENFPPSWFTPQDESPSLNLLFLILSFIFCPTSFRREWVAFLGAWFPLLCSEVVLWKLLNIQIIFLMNFLGRNWSPHLIPSPSWDCPSKYGKY